MKDLSRYATTKNAAPLLGVKPPTLRIAFCVKGHYLGIKPVKLPNRLLMWSLDDIERVLQGDAK